MQQVYESPLLLAEPSIALGIAGWGLASLHFFLRSREEVYLRRALEGGDQLLKMAQVDESGFFWRSDLDKRVHYGLGYGASGVALFLLYLFQLTKRPDFIDCARKAIEYDLANKVESEVGWQWKRYEGDTVLYPYWIHGSAGIGAVLVRFAHLCNDERYWTLARQIASDTLIKYAFVPSLFEGLAGIGELMLDLYRFTGEEGYRRDALDVAETVLWFKMERPEGIAYSGRWLTRISNDYATGAAGIGLFLQRLLHPGPQLLVDLPIPGMP
jgi:lantibiotic modifying enzyme